jgi:hypothetical protein
MSIHYDDKPVLLYYLIAFIHLFFFNSYFLSFVLYLYSLFGTSLIQLNILFSLFSIFLVTLLAFFRADYI